MVDADVESGRQVKQKDENKKDAGKAPDFSSTCCWFFYQKKGTISSQQAVSNWHLLVQLITLSENKAKSSISVSEKMKPLY